MNIDLSGCRIYNSLELLLECFIASMLGVGLEMGEAKATDGARSLEEQYQKGVLRFTAMWDV
jgi:hypothetical protein